MTLLLSCDSLDKSYGVRPLFRGLSISFDDTERTGLIGPNGSGKSTLLKILAGAEPPDSGEIVARRGLKLAYVPQQDTFPAGQTVHGAVTGALHGAHLDEHEAEVKASILLGKMGFTDPIQRIDDLSGGWRKRTAIARALITDPDLLLLDEPTNHLDLEGILWLESLLKTAPFSVLLVSHDRWFLENVTNRTVELSRAYADGYLSINGPYSEFLGRREEYLAAQARNEQALASKVRREIEWLRRGAKARTTKAKGRIEQAGQMMSDLAELKTRNSQTGKIDVDFTASGRQTRKLLEGKKLAKSLGGRTLFSNLDLVLRPGQRLGLLGPNGSGKTTLIRLLAGEIEPDAGQVVRAEGLKVVWFEQSRQSLDKSQTLKRALSPVGDTISFRGSSMHVSGWAQKFLFRTEQLDLPVGSLSGGEQARVQIARLMLMPADLLILDEPTNDLDIPSLEVLEDSLSEFPGALVLVTHDRFMLDSVSTELLALDGTGGANFYASYWQWEQAQEAKAEAQRQAAKESARAQSASKPQPAAKVKLTWKEQRELEGMEAAILEAEEALHACQRRMADPTVLADHVKLTDACHQADAAQQKVTALYARWEELEAKRGGG